MSINKAKKIIKSAFLKMPTFYSLVFSSFDVYQRFKNVSNIIKKQDIKSILDVGGARNHIKYFIKNKHIVTLDSHNADVIGTGLKIPFKNNCFDAVVSIDTFEYIPTKDKTPFLKELDRVATKIIIIAAPFNLEQVVGAEKECNAFYKILYKKPHHWLSITESLGLPDLSSTLKIFKKYNIKIFDSNYLPRWKFMIKLNFILFPYLYPIGIFINLLYNIIFYNGDFKSPAYHKIILINKK